ncbi:MAG: hypothetical protein K5644_06340 [Lachnospiraceae bacterium]|nr:hypothetical protein [Lachnospiraceae bacterium]
MKQILDEYGSTIITTIVGVIIIAVLGVVSFNGAVGLINIAGRETSDIADNDTNIVQTVTTASLDNQAELAVPDVRVKTKPKLGTSYKLTDVFELNNCEESASLSVAEATTELNDSSTDAIGTGMITLNSDTIKFNNVDTFYITLEIRQDSRKMSRTLEVTSLVPDPYYDMQKVNGYWCYCKNEWNVEKGGYTRTVIRQYPYSKTVHYEDGPPTQPNVGSYINYYLYYDESKKCLRYNMYDHYCSGWHANQVYRNGEWVITGYSIDGFDSYRNSGTEAIWCLNKQTGLPTWVR